MAQLDDFENLLEVGELFLMKTGRFWTYFGSFRSKTKLWLCSKNEFISTFGGGNGLLCEIVVDCKVHWIFVDFFCDPPWTRGGRRRWAEPKTWNFMILKKDPPGKVEFIPRGGVEGFGKII